MYAFWCLLASEKLKKEKLLVLVNKWLENKEKEGKVLKWHTWPVRSSLDGNELQCQTNKGKKVNIIDNMSPQGTSWEW